MNPSRHAKVLLSFLSMSLLNLQQTPPHMLVMCRRDALRAAGEELLSRSQNQQLRERAFRKAGWRRKKEEERMMASSANF